MKVTEVVSMIASPRAHVPPNLKLVANIGLSVAMVSCLGLILVLVLIGSDKAHGYALAIASLAITRQDLGPAMLLFGMALVGFSGIAAWLFSLYTSFRVAGPLFRISRDLQRQIQHGPITPMPIRAGDSLQAQWQEFAVSVTTLRAHREELRRAVIDVEHALGTSTAAAGQAIARLKAAEQHVRL